MSKGQQGPWTDIYALSATMYKCITGQVPEEALQRMQLDELKKPSELGFLISIRFENALMCGLSVKQEDRYQSIDSFISAVQGFDVESEYKKSETNDVITKDMYGERRNNRKLENFVITEDIQQVDDKQEQNQNELIEVKKNSKNTDEKQKEKKGKKEVKHKKEKESKKIKKIGIFVAIILSICIFLNFLPDIVLGIIDLCLFFLFLFLNSFHVFFNLGFITISIRFVEFLTT